jgi:hypothetical protein
MREVPAKCPKGMDALSYASGYIQGKRALAKYTIRAVDKSLDDRRR